MIPVLKAVHGAPGAPLVEEMPGTLVAGEAVGVTGKTCDGLYMVGLAIDGFADFVIKIGNFIGAVKHSVALFRCPLSHKADPPVSDCSRWLSAYCSLHYTVNMYNSQSILRRLIVQNDSKIPCSHAVLDLLEMPEALPANTFHLPSPPSPLSECIEVLLFFAYT
jgi:hypothetical protein